MTTDPEGRLSHIYWPTREQIRFAAPLGVLVVVDGEFNSRIAAQSIPTDATTDTVVWILEACRESSGRDPSLFIQDADAAMTAVAKKAFPEALMRRSLWHLHQSVTKALASDMGADMEAFLLMFKTPRAQTSLGKFEKMFNDICEKCPEAERYLMVIYADRERWAGYFALLAFSQLMPKSHNGATLGVLSPASSRLVRRSSSANSRKHSFATLNSRCRKQKWRGQHRPALLEY